MSDYSELKTAATRIIEVQTSQDVPINKLFDEFDALASPEAVLALISEVDSLNDEISACKTSPGGCSYWKEAARMREQERDQLKAEVECLTADNASLRGSCAKLGVERAGMVRIHRKANTEIRRLSAEVEALRKLAPSKEIIWCACGDGYPVNSYGAGFMDANNGVCANCDAAMNNGEQP